MSSSQADFTLVVNSSNQLLQNRSQLTSRTHTRSERLSSGSVHETLVDAPIAPLAQSLSRSTPDSGANDDLLLRGAEDEQFLYPNRTLRPHFTRKHVTLIAISGTIGTGLFLGSGVVLVESGPLSIFLGYAVMSSVVYGMVVSTAEMVSVYPYCRGTVALADRFVDPALGFAMGWNAFFHWGITVSTQIGGATSLIKYWQPSKAVIWSSPAIFIILTSGSVFGTRIYGELESSFALLKLFVVAVLILMALLLDCDHGAHGSGPLRYWDPPMNQYLGMDGAMGRFLGFFEVFMQAAYSFYGTDIPMVIAAELKDAPRVLYPVAKRVWLRITIIYMVAIFAAGTLVPRQKLEDQMNSPPNDAPWLSSPFITALAEAGPRYQPLVNTIILCFIISAASAASATVFISARTLYYLAKAGHAPEFFGVVWPKRKNRQANDNAAVVPWAGVLASVGFATLSWFCVRPKSNAMSNMEKAFVQVEGMATSACLQAWVATLFTYLRFWRGTRYAPNQSMYREEIHRIRQNRAWGQPFWALWSFSLCIFILIFHGWSLFKKGKWVIVSAADPKTFDTYQILQFVTTYAPIPLFILLLFGYKLICQTSMVRAATMDFSGVAGRDVNSTEPTEPRPTTFWARLWWILVK